MTRKRRGQKEVTNNGEPRRPDGTGKRGRSAAGETATKGTRQLRPGAQTGNELVEFRKVRRGEGGGDGPEQSSARPQRPQGNAEHGGSKEQQKREKNRQFQEKPAEAWPAASMATRKQRKAQILARPAASMATRKLGPRPQWPNPISPLPPLPTGLGTHRKGGHIAGKTDYEREITLFPDNIVKGKTRFLDELREIPFLAVLVTLSRFR